MAIYYLFFGLQLVLILGARAAGVRDNKFVVGVCALIAALFAGLRGDVGADTSAYRSFYDDPQSLPNEAAFEPMFHLFALVGHALGAGSQFLILCVAALQGLLMYALARTSRQSDLLYLLILSNFYVYLNFNLIRVGLALYLMALALLIVRSGGSVRVSIATFISAVATHFSIAVMVPALWRRWYRAIPVLVLLGAVGWDFVAQKLFNYVLEGNLVTTDFSLGIGFVVVTVLTWYCIVKEGLASDRLIVVLFVIYTLLKAAGLLVPIVDRVAIVIAFALYALLVNAIRHNGSKAAIIAIALYGVYGSLSFVANSDQAIEDLIAEFPGMAMLYADPRWVPYKFFWEL